MTSKGVQRRAKEYDCPFVAWSLFFAEPYNPSNECIPHISALLAFFKATQATWKDQREQPSVAVHYSSLQEHCALIAWDTKLVFQPVEFLACLNCAFCQAVYDLDKSSREALPNGDFKYLPTKTHVRILHLPHITHLKELKANIMGKFISIRGTVVRVSNVKPIVTQMSFTCTACSKKFPCVFSDGKYKVPSKCADYTCKGRTFVPDRGMGADTQTVDWQRIRIQEKLADDQVDSGRIPRTAECEVKDDLVDLVGPGDVVCVSGIVKILSVEEGKGRNKSSEMYSLYIDTNSLVKASTLAIEEADGGTSNTEGFTKDYVHFSTKELLGIRAIKEYGGDNVFRILVNSLCPPIFGHEIVKAGLLLGLLGGRRRLGVTDKDISIRGDPHVLVVGDPGLGKSQMLSATVKAAPRGVYVCGNTTTTSGLTVTICKDADTHDTSLEAGALVLSDQGVCCIDEFDKMTEHQALLEAMEQQSISIAKAGLVCTLPARCSVIAAANPVGGHYNKAKSVSENLRMNSALLSRFDLVFILLDKPDQEMDLFISEHIMKVHVGKKLAKASEKDKRWEPESVMAAEDDNVEVTLIDRLKIRREEPFEPIPPTLLRKYIAYARKYAHPALSIEAATILQEFYLTLRSKYRSVDNIPITTRQLESMIRLSEARARAELRETVTATDAQEIVELMKSSLWDSYSDENGKTDFSRSQHGTGMSKRGEPKRFIAELSRQSYLHSNNKFSTDEMYKIANDMNLSFTNFQDLLDSLNNQGYILKKGARLYQLTTS